MKLNTSCATAVVLCLASACAKEEQARTVDYYRTHPEERRVLVQDCANDPARARDRPACINAKAAEVRESIGSVQDLPPMGLLPGGTNAGDTKTSEPKRGDAR